MPILILWVLCALLGGVFVDFRRTSGGQLMVERERVLEEEGGAVVGVFCPIPSGLASGPWNALYEHFRL